MGELRLSKQHRELETINGGEHTVNLIIERYATLIVT